MAEGCHAVRLQVKTQLYQFIGGVGQLVGLAGGIHHHIHIVHNGSNAAEGAGERVNIAIVMLVVNDKISELFPKGQAVFPIHLGGKNIVQGIQILLVSMVGIPGTDVQIAGGIAALDLADSVFSRGNQGGMVLILTVVEVLDDRI